MIDILNIGQKSIQEIGYFDTYPHESQENGIVNNQRSGDPGGHDGNKGNNSPFSMELGVFIHTFKVGIL